MPRAEAQLCKTNEEASTNGPPAVLLTRGENGPDPREGPPSLLLQGSGT